MITSDYFNLLYLKSGYPVQQCLLSFLYFWFFFPLCDFNHKYNRNSWKSIGFWCGTIVGYMYNDNPGLLIILSITPDGKRHNIAKCNINIGPKIITINVFDSILFAWCNYPPSVIFHLNLKINWWQWPTDSKIWIFRIRTKIV